MVGGWWLVVGGVVRASRHQVEDDIRCEWPHWQPLQVRHSLLVQLSRRQTQSSLPARSESIRTTRLRISVKRSDRRDSSGQYQDQGVFFSFHFYLWGLTNTKSANLTRDDAISKYTFLFLERWRSNKKLRGLIPDYCISVCNLSCQVEPVHQEEAVVVPGGAELHLPPSELHRHGGGRLEPAGSEHWPPVGGGEMSSRATVSCDVQALRSCQGDDPAGGGRGGGAGPQSVRLLPGGQSCSVLWRLYQHVSWDWPYDVPW